MPVAGPVGLGTAAAMQDRGTGFIIGVDSDWRATSPEYADIILTSVMKRMDVSVVEVAKQVSEGTFEGGAYLSTLANGGVTVTDGPYATDISDLQEMIIAGDIQTTP
jgi:basic membrane protein A